LPIVRLNAVALYLSQRLALIISRHLQHSLPTNTPSPPQDMTAIHTRVSTEHLPTWNILTAAGHATGPEISASRWLNCARAILHCWWPTCTASDVETPPLVHIAMVHRDGRTSGVTLPSTRPGAVGVMAKSPLSKRPKTPMELPGEDRGGDPSPRPGMRERENLQQTRDVSVDMSVTSLISLCFVTDVANFPMSCRCG